MKVIHIGNMAGDSYNNVKFLRSKGIEADLVIDPRAHVTEHPQWNEGDFEGEVDEWAPKWEKIQVRGYETPAWLKYASLGVSLRPPQLLLNLRRHNLLVRDYDIVQAAVLEPINCLLIGIKPYISYSKGSDLRDVPFMHSARARFMALAHRRASKVFITNPDTFDSANRLKLNNTCYMPFIIDETRYMPVKTSLRQTLKRDKEFDFLIFAASRHSWHDKGNDKLLRAFANFIKTERASSQLVLLEWGLDLNRSKQLVNELNINDKVMWFPMMNKSRLVEFYSASDIVFDHVNLSSYGTTPLEAMACEKPVIAKLPRHDIARRCWNEDLPPLLGLHTEEQITRVLSTFSSDRSLREKVGRESREWVIRHHNWRPIIDKHIEVYEEILSRT